MELCVLHPTWEYSSVDQQNRHSKHGVVLKFIDSSRLMHFHETHFLKHQLKGNSTSGFLLVVPGCVHSSR